MDHLDALERLHRLMESGALSEAEFAEQKARILAAADAPPVAAAAPAPVEAEFVAAAEPQRNLLPIIGWGVASLALLGGIVWTFSGSSGDRALAPSATASAAASDAAAAVATTAAPVLASLPEAERLRLAAIAALGFSGTRRTKDGQQPVITKALRVLDLPFATVLLTSTERPDDCHACQGYVGVYYLSEVDGKYKVTGKWPKAVSGWGWGNVPEWRISSDYTANPAVVASGSDGNQGYFCGGTTITELTAKGPVTSFIATSATNSGSVDPDTGVNALGDPLKDLDGQIMDVKKGKSLQVKVTGTDSFTESYVMRGGKFELASGETRLGC